jgi:hypothetical protein
MTFYIIPSISDLVGTAVTIMNLRARKEHKAKTGSKNVRSFPKAFLSQSSCPLSQVYTKSTELPSYLFRDWRGRTILTSASGH